MEFLYLNILETGLRLYLRGTGDYPLTTLSGSSSSYTTRYYVYSPAGLIAVVDNGTTYFIAKDHLGSTCGVLNSSNNSKNSWYAYTPYGNVWTGSVNEDPSYKFTGQECEQEFGLYNFRAREYDPTLGIFCAADAAGQDFSPYMYCGGKPTMFTDPTGRLWWLAALEVIKDAYEIYSAAKMAYGTYEAIKSGDLGNIVGAGMGDAFTLASLGVGGSGHEDFHFSSWAENAGFSGLESAAGYYAGGGKSLMGGLGSFGEGAGFATLSMATEYGEINQWQPPAMTNEAVSAMPAQGTSTSTLMMGAVPALSPMISYYQNAQLWAQRLNDYGVGYGSGYDWWTGVDCSSYICLASGDLNHTWTTGLDVPPPGNYYPVSVNESSRRAFFNSTREGDVWAWAPADYNNNGHISGHAVFYGGGMKYLWESNPFGIGRTTYANPYIDKMGFPDYVYRQR